MGIHYIKIGINMINGSVDKAMDIALDSAHLKNNGFTFGWRLKHIRTLRSLTQHELGIKCGFPEKGADLRIRQYESNIRHPKDDIVSLLSKELRISEEMLSAGSPDLQVNLFINILWADIIGVMNVFEGELYNSRYKETFNPIDISVVANVPGIVPSCECNLLNWLNALNEMRNYLKIGSLSEKMFRDWEYGWKP